MKLSWKPFYWPHDMFNFPFAVRGVKMELKKWPILMSKVTITSLSVHELSNQKTVLGQSGPWRLNWVVQMAENGRSCMKLDGRKDFQWTAKVNGPKDKNGTVSSRQTVRTLNMGLWVELSSTITNDRPILLRSPPTIVPESRPRAKWRPLWHKTVFFGRTVKTHERPSTFVPLDRPLWILLLQVTDYDRGGFSPSYAPFDHKYISLYFLPNSI